MSLHITHFFSWRTSRRIYLRYRSQGDRKAFYIERAKLLGYDVEESEWLDDFLWIDGKQGAWCISGDVWLDIIDDFENGLEEHCEEEQRLKDEEEPSPPYDDALDTLYEMFHAVNEIVLWPSQQTRQARASAPTEPLILTPETVVPSQFIRVEKIQTVSEAYSELNLRPGVDGNSAKKAYRHLAMQYSPDRNPGEADCERKIRRLNMARDIVYRHLGIS